MKITNILIASPMYKEIKKIIEGKGIQKNIHYLPDSEVTENDLILADAFVGFNIKSNLNYSQVKWVHSLGAGVDRFLFKKEWDQNVLLTRTIGSFGQRIAEYCLSYILKDIQFHDLFEDCKEKKKWHPVMPKLLNEQKVMIYGTGEIGQAVAGVLSSYGVEVYGVSLSGRKKEHFNEVMKVDSHLIQLSKMDYIINTLPLTDKTEKLFNENIFNQLAGAGFINVGRGASLDEGALLHALNDQHVRFAVLDVFAVEPLPYDSKLWNHPNVWITPHISAVTTPQEGVNCFIETLINIEENKYLPNKVDVKKGY